MAVREVVKIDEDLCNGCGDCVPSCAEGAIQIVDGVAKLMADNLCDGLGACLGDCPEGAITIEKRDADSFDEGAVKKRLESQKNDQLKPVPSPALSPIMGHHAHEGPGCGCPGAKTMGFEPLPTPGAHNGAHEGPQPSALRQWPVQLHLVSPIAPYFEKSDVLLAADCVAFAVGDFHREHMKNRSLAIACPKLDPNQEIYLQKLITMIDESKINSLNVMVMEVPCCAGLVTLAKEAASKASRKIPVKKIVVSIQGGEILSEEWI
jgi:NAD-dependent dihydropyrimidine dehydrogenase PreA subunit